MMHDVMSGIFAVIFFILLLVVPGFLTLWNLANCFFKKPKGEKILAPLGVIGGGFMYGMMQSSFDYGGDWYEPIYSFQTHYSLSPRYPVVYFALFLGIMALFVLVYAKAETMPPLVSAICISLLVLFNIYQLFYMIQLVDRLNIQHMFLYIYQINLLILSGRIIRDHMKQTVEMFRKDEAKIQVNSFFCKLFGKMDTLSKYSAFIFVVFFFVVAILEIIFVLTGQGIDAPVKTFTDTADWTFSQQTPPPPLEYDGHYLCTVAAGGHKKIVKPIRYGTRIDHTIIVNRQLCIANAFEDVIKERTPRFHRFIRGVYDRYGYPVSNLITAPWKADIVYILMKPLEWIFLLFLYLVDTRPEKRIARQYLYRG